MLKNIFILSFISFLFNIECEAKPKIWTNDEINAVESEAEILNKKKLNFLKKIKLGQVINGWEVTELTQEEDNYRATFEGNLRAKIDYYYEVSGPCYEGQELNSFNLTPSTKLTEKLPFNKMYELVLEDDTVKMTDIAEGSYGLMDVVITKIELVFYNSDVYQDYMYISRLVKIHQNGISKQDQKNSKGECDNETL